MKLFTAICNDARLLGQFLQHYRNYGVTEFLVAVAPDFKSAVACFADRYRITMYDDLNVADSVVGGTTAVSEMRRRHQLPSEWVVIVDLDEFVEFGTGIHDILHWAELEQANVVRGIMWDRFPCDGRVVGFEPDADLARVYPIRARFIRNVMRGADWKGVLVKGLLDAVAAHHVFENEVICTRELEISHYKWFAGGIDRLRVAYDMVMATAQPWAAEYERILIHYERYGRFAWEKFGGEVAPNNRPLALTGIPFPCQPSPESNTIFGSIGVEAVWPEHPAAWCIGEVARSKAAFEAAIIDHWNAIAPTLAQIDKHIAESSKARNIRPIAHPHDLSVEESKIAVAATDRPDLLRDLMQTARYAFGFYTCHFPFTINHTWAAKHLEEMPAGARALDIGSGLSPMPLFLARRGLVVDCVDDSELVRTPPPQPDWHEWGFFDYGALHPNLRSYHCDVLQFEPDEKYQVIYSICVLAHLTAAAREQVLSRCKSWLRPGGTLLVTFDVLRDTEFVWNLRLGEEFEPRSQHGTITGLMSGLDNLGFQINDRVVLRNVHGASSDLFLLACTV